MTVYAVRARKQAPCFLVQVSTPLAFTTSSACGGSATPTLQDDGGDRDASDLGAEVYGAGEGEATVVFESGARQ